MPSESIWFTVHRLEARLSAEEATGHCLLQICVLLALWYHERLIQDFRFFSSMRCCSRSSPTLR